MMAGTAFAEAAANVAEVYLSEKVYRKEHNVILRNSRKKTQ